MPGPTSSLAFAGRGRELRVGISSDIDAPALRKSLSIFLPGWPARPLDGVSAPPDISIAPAGSGFRVRAESWPGGESLADDPNNAANALAGLLIDAILAHGMAAHCLHAAAAEIGGRAILFAGPAEAGKSTLALRLAVRGARHLADDRILLAGEAAPYHAVALGLAAKARKPLPPGDGLAALVEQRWHMTDDAIAYLHLQDEEVAKFGEEVDLGAIVVPRRSAGVTAGLEAAQPAEIARTLIEETTSPAGPGAVVAAMTRLAGSVEGYILAYDDGEAAVDLLLNAFEG
ncbi:MAG: hypothetical protein JJ899_01570 [Alphaproteobacteria bacterium]|nr:hypothetical protein [Alphaproteobacteria bacterium]